MKRGVIVAAAAISMAGAASAHLLSASPHARASHGTAATSAPQEPAVQVPDLPSRTALSEPRGQTAGKPAPVRAERRASVDIHQSPVPLQTKPKPPVYVPAPDTTEAYARGEAGSIAKASALPPGANPAASDDPAGEAAARKAIEADGYKGVEILRKGENGVWYAKGLRGKIEVQLAVDSRGMVSTAD
jgi:hypothetical protein